MARTASIDGTAFSGASWAQRAGRASGVLRPTLRLERRLAQRGYRVVAGVDEAGRGPLAGPVAAGAVVLPLAARPPWIGELRDSKILAPARRQRLAALILASAPAAAVGWASPSEVDALGIVAATGAAMRRALAACRIAPDFVLVDGRDEQRFACPHAAVVRGDGTVASIAAASIIAKVARDARMEELAARETRYGFARHKGYGTPEHLAALRRYGPCPEHRRSYAPVRAALARSG